MKVLLIENVDKLGLKGEVHEVKDGYGMNFLIRKNLAILASKDAINRWKAEEKRLEQRREAELQECKDLATKLENITCKIIKKVGANGILYAAVTKDEIASILKYTHHLDIDKKNINLKNPLKSTGIYDLDIKLGHAIHATLKLDIEAK